ncbi:hypothetical protein JVU11DRAFT_5505 [Chiua virens]|nr:hypothetical protein JVU11DRAFT_5505 [Chiua virens]
MSHSGNIEFWPIPPEVAEQALLLCHPRDIASFTQTCRAACSLVNDTLDQYFWRQLFLLFPFDDPRQTCRGLRKDLLFDWKTELQRRVQVEIITRSPRSTYEELHATLATLLSVVRSASPVPHDSERMPSLSLAWVMHILESTNILQLSLSPQRRAFQTLSRLRSYLALTLDNDDDEFGKLHLKSRRTTSRSQVYNLSNYHRDNDWGPFTPKSREVDWFHVECIVNVISFNLADHSRHFWERSRLVVSKQLERIQLLMQLTSPPMIGQEWRETGDESFHSWIIAFNVDEVLLPFAVQNRGGHARGELFFEDPHFSEATRLIELKLYLITSDAVPKYYTLERFPQSEDAMYPTLYFSGSSFGIHGNEATVVGSVYMCDDGVVRWRFVSVREGRMQWSSEGVQLGGIASAMGIVGTWTGAHHERGDPAGKMKHMLWKTKVDGLPMPIHRSFLALESTQRLPNVDSRFDTSQLR